MKKIFFLILVLVLLTSFNTADITNSAHDFSDEDWVPGQRICLPCHTPHNARTDVNNAPLWNHELSEAVYQLYGGTGTLNSTPGQPEGSSKLCLSCHDGTVALENFGDVTNGTTYVDGGRNFGTDLSNDHPISITYDSALATADGGLFDPTSTPSGLGGTIADDLLFGPNNDQLQCSSCHDVHNAEDNNYLLRVNPASSALCLTCHDK